MYFIFNRPTTIEKEIKKCVCTGKMSEYKCRARSPTKITSAA